MEKKKNVKLEPFLEDLRRHSEGMVSAIQEMDHVLEAYARFKDRVDGSPEGLPLAPMPINEWPWPWPKASWFRKRCSDIGHNPHHYLKEAFIRHGETVLIDPMKFWNIIRQQSFEEWKKVWRRNGI